MGEVEPEEVEEDEEPARIVHPRRLTPAEITRFLEDMWPTEELEREIMAMEEAQGEFQ